MEGSNERVSKCTTPYFEGVVGLVDPAGSWVARWQRIDSCKPGMYAVEMIGVLPERNRNYCLDNGIPFKGKPNKTT